MLREFSIYASKEKTEKEPSPQIFKGTVFAKNQIMAKGKMCKMLRTQHKIKSTQTVILKLQEVEQHKDMRVRTFGITAMYMSKKGKHNYYKEFRSTTRTEAVERLFQEIGSRHHVQSEKVTIMNVVEVPRDEVSGEDILQLNGDDAKFPLFDQRVPASYPIYMAALNE